MEFTNDQMIARIAELEEANRQLSNRKPSFGLKVSEKRGVSLYGEGRFPITLYKEQWLRVLDRADEIRDFIHAHEGVLAVKPVKAVASTLTRFENGERVSA